MPGLPGFRRIAGGDVSAGGDPALLGLSSQERPEIDAGTFCAGLFVTEVPPGAVPVAYFSDSRCAFCRVMSPMLKQMEERGEIAVTWHEFPILSEASEVAARAALAARQQGAYVIFHQRLMGTPFLPNAAYLRAIAADAGIDAHRLMKDMETPVVDRQLATTAALARRLGFYGTPGLVIGRTVVLGQLDDTGLRRLVMAERAESAPGPCG